LCSILRFQNFCVWVSKTKNQCRFSKCFFKLGFSDLGLNHNKNNARFKVKVEWGIGGLKSKWRRLMKRFDSTKQKYNHLFRARTFLTNFLHRHHQNFMIEVIGEHQDNPAKHEWDGNY
jgi:hypothetical protein